MAVTEHGRIVLYRHFEEDMGEEKALTLMDHLLPVGWTELATKQDLSLTKQDLQVEFAGVRTEIATVRTEMAELRADLQHEFHVQMLGLVGVMVGLQGVLIAALKFL